MPHVLARLAGVRLDDVKRQLETDASAHAAQGMFLEHLWQNAEDPTEVLFLFRVDDLNACRERTARVHAEVRRQDPNAKLPQMLFLDDG